MITEGYQTNFQTLVEAIKDGNVCLVECKEAATGDPVMVICAINKYNDLSVFQPQYEMVPLAKLFNGNPYKELMPPEIEGEAK